MTRHAASGQRATTSASFPIPDCADAVARASGMTERLRATAARIEAGRALPSDIIAALHEARLFRLLLPRSLGGDELDLKTLAEVIEVIAAAAAACCSVWPPTRYCCARVRRAGSPHKRRRALDASPRQGLMFWDRL